MIGSSSGWDGNGKPAILGVVFRPFTYRPGSESPEARSRETTQRSASEISILALRCYVNCPVRSRTVVLAFFDRPARPTPHPLPLQPLPMDRWDAASNTAASSYVVPS